MTLAVLFVVLFALLAIGVPVAYSLLAGCLAALVLTTPGITIGMVAQTITTATDSFPIMAVPFFILAGVIMGRGGISKRLFALANTLVGHIPGGVGVAAVLTAMFFAAISGSGPATVAAVGSIMIPEMVKVGYSRAYSAALIASAGTIGIVIPPSIPLVIYGVVTGSSIGDLFLGGILPGILMGLSLMGWVVTHARRAGIPRAPKATGAERLAALKGAVWGLLMPVVILGGIYGGIFTPTEAGVVAVVYGLVLAYFGYREISFKELFDVVVSSTLTTSAILIIVASAAIFGRFLTIQEAPRKMVDLMGSVSDNKIVILLMVNLLLILLGTFMETIASVTITAPILYPVLTMIGLDPVHIGVMMIVILSIGFITPPLGLNLFVASTVARVSTGDTVRQLIPGFFALVACGLIVSFVPFLTMAFVG